MFIFLKNMNLNYLIKFLSELFEYWSGYSWWMFAFCVLDIRIYNIICTYYLYNIQYDLLILQPFLIFKIQV